MGFIATAPAESGNFKKVPSGNFIGRCYSMIDLGTQTTEFEGDIKHAHKIRLSWELFGEDESGEPLTIDVDGKTMPLTISKKYTLSMHEKAGLRIDLTAWRGKAFSDEEAKAFDVTKLLGAYAMVNVTIREGKNGKTYSNVANLSPLPSALKNAKPAAVHANQVFNLDAPDMKLFATFWDGLQEEIKQSPEWKKKAGSFDEAPSDNFEEIPF
jgi:hypothetical protein